MFEQEKNECRKQNLDKESMSEWRLEDCPPYADTYIEWRFEKRCKEYRNGVQILTEWRERKNQFISYLQTSVFDFQHYSRHDESHAVNILESIEMLLGKDRVDKLSIGDLWMLLECAYSHDIGMSLSYEELVELWETDTCFKKYIEDVLAEGKEGQDAAAFYTFVDNLLKSKEKFDNLDHYLERIGNSDSMAVTVSDSWPVELERGLQEIVAEFVRREHPKKISKTIERLDTKKNPEIPVRLYKLVMQAGILHGESFEKIFEKLPPCEKGFGNSKLHPRFAAMMLRVGDLLDLDNNRFNVRALEHYGELPPASILHLKKHKAITHLSIRPDGIEVEAKSSETKVCAVVERWFQMLRREIDNLICAWNQVVPDELRGCLMTPCKAVVYLQVNGKDDEYGSELSIQTDSEFQIDKTKLIKLLMGTNIYYSPLDFIREYLQNALDASKMKLWLDIKDEKWRYSNDMRWEDDKKKLTPFDIGTAIYEQYAIEIFVELDTRKRKVLLTITDKGIGIEKESVAMISKVGGGWRARQNYQRELNEMPEWLKPTGGFGIGLQSAFMVSDKVEIVTRGVNESEGRKLTLYSPKGKGEISNEALKNVKEGTTVKVEFDYFKFIETTRKVESAIYKDMEKQEYEPYRIGMESIPHGDFFSEEAVKNYVLKFVENYVRRYFAGTMIPFRMIYKKGGRKCWSNIVGLKFPQIQPEFREKKMDGIMTKNIRTGEYILRPYKGNRDEEYFTREISIEGKDFLAIYIPAYQDREERKIFWNRKDEILAEIKYLSPRYSMRRKAEQNYVCFKNAKINREISVEAPYAIGYDVFVDYEGFYAEKILKVHREEFNQKFQGGRKYIDELFRGYYHFLRILNNENLLKEQEELFGYIPQMIQILYLRQPLELVQTGIGEGNSDTNISSLVWAYDEEYETLDKFERINIRFSKMEQDIFAMVSQGESMFVRVPKEEQRRLLETLGKVTLIHPQDAKAWRDSISMKWLGQELEKWWMETQNVVDDSCISDYEEFKKIISEVTGGWLTERKTYFANKSCSGEEGAYKSLKLLRKLYQSGYVLDDEAIINFLINCPGIKKEYFQLERNGDIYAELYFSEETRVLTENEFYQNSYNSKDEMHVFRKDECPKYMELLISELPFPDFEREEYKEGYVISPISVEAYEELQKVKMMGGMDGVLIETVSCEKFTDIIMGKASFEALLSWVYLRQIEKDRYSLHQIRSVYVDYIQDIYRWWSRNL